MEGAQPPLAAGKTPGPLFAFLPPNPPGALARGHRVPRPAQSRLGTGLAHFPLSFPNAAAEELTTPGLKKAHTPPLHEDANTAVIAVVITLVFITLLTVLVVIIIYLYRNKGSYLTYEQPAAETDVSVQMEDAPSKEKEEYFI
uniref:Small cell adhesion glycoprotein n=2 Tax=Anser TaxID=8842 RepID=A0A8B9BK92_9AVES